MMSRKLVKSTGTILINRNAEWVFDFFCNPGNDNLWRTEINQSIINGPLEPGTKIFEYSDVSKKASNNLTELKCVQFEKNKLAIFETNENTPFYIRNQRHVKAISDNSTEIIYNLSDRKSTR